MTSLFDPIRLGAFTAPNRSAMRRPARCASTRSDGTFGKSDSPPVHPAIRKIFRGPLVLNSDYSFESAQAALATGQADAIGFGRAFIANPDLPHRFTNHLPITTADMATWYSQGEKGYTDYPSAQIAQV